MFEFEETNTFVFSMWLHLHVSETRWKKVGWMLLYIRFLDVKFATLVTKPVKVLRTFSKPENISGNISNSTQSIRMMATGTSEFVMVY